jgi:hypothetical protein
MIEFGVLSGGLIRCGVLVSPCFTPQAVQERGPREFYRRLGVGYSDGMLADASPSTKLKGPYASTPVNRVSFAPVPHHSRARKL